MAHRQKAAGPALLLAAVLAVTAFFGVGGPQGRQRLPAAAPAEPVAVEPTPAAPTAAAPTLSPAPAPAGVLGYRAVWISYLEWQGVDFSAPARFLADVEPMLDHCAALGLTTVIAQVRPFADALYPSALFPFSHLCAGVQGQSPGYDPLALLIAATHSRGLRLEAWVNPYRVQAGALPGALAPENPALLHPDWAREAAGGLYLDPALPEVRQYIADGVAELCQNYAVDGIHFDDYFYPTTDPAFDAAQYAAYAAGGGALSQAAWRCANVDALVALCYRTVHGFGGITFGISPQGCLENNAAGQYSDVARWLRTPGYVDYLLPQLYWGMAYRAAGSDALCFARCAESWLALPRAEGVALYFGLGAFRIGAGDGSKAAASEAEWAGGRALAEQAGWLRRQGCAGFALYRYGSLWGGEHPVLAAAECKNLSTVIFGL